MTQNNGSSANSFDSLTDELSLFSPETMQTLDTNDPDIARILNEELNRQQHQLEMIASENFASRAVLAAQGSVLTNKYAEGYPGRRYYNGCEVVDQAEVLAIERACALFDCCYANVQPHSGSSANIEVFMALMKPGETYLGMDLSCGGHLTHGSKVNFSGKWFNAVGYGLSDATHLIDMDQVRQLAHEHKPKLIITGGSAYSREIDFAEFRKIADEVGAYLWVDMAHFAGLVAGKQMTNPLKFAHVVTSTTHKTLRGPRGGIILSNEPELSKKLNSAVFPGLQGGPLMHVIAAKAVAFKEALQPQFQDYAAQVIRNAQMLSETLKAGGLDIVSGGTDCHLILVDLRPFNINGRDASNALERAGITCNKNSVHGDPKPPQETSGLRFGSPALTTRGMKEQEFRQIGDLIVDVLRGVQSGDSTQHEARCRQAVGTLCHQFPLYQNPKTSF